MTLRSPARTAIETIIGSSSNSYEIYQERDSESSLFRSSLAWAGIAFSFTSHRNFVHSTLAQKEIFCAAAVWKSSWTFLFFKWRGSFKLPSSTPSSYSTAHLLFYASQSSNERAYVHSQLTVHWLARAERLVQQLAHGLAAFGSLEKCSARWKSSHVPE